MNNWSRPSEFPFGWWLVITESTICLNKSDTSHLNISFFNVISNALHCTIKKSTFSLNLIWRRDNTRASGVICLICVNLNASSAKSYPEFSCCRRRRRRRLSQRMRRWIEVRKRHHTIHVACTSTSHSMTEILRYHVVKQTITRIHQKNITISAARERLR